MNNRPSPTSLLSAARHDLLINALYGPLITQPLHFAPTLNEIAPSGAAQWNAKWERGESEKWFIEQQRFGCELIQAGLVMSDPSLVDLANLRPAMGV